jgi:hypothetical protein
MNMGWEVLPYPPYGSDLAPSDYHLFGFWEESDARPTLRDERASPDTVRQCLEWQLERNSAAREYSDFQNGGKNAYSETGAM